MTETAVGPVRRTRLPLHSRLLSRRSRPGVSPAVCDAELEPRLRIPLSDGVEVLADHYLPLTGRPAPTILIRTPYGRGFPWGHLFGATFARRGFHVLIASCRGTGGSQGEWSPFHGEAEDGLDVVRWLRGRPWFDHRLITLGPSYLGHTQLALAANDIPEWRTAWGIGPANPAPPPAPFGGVLPLGETPGRRFFLEPKTRVIPSA